MKEVEYQKKYIKKLVDTTTKFLTDEDKISAPLDIYQIPAKSYSYTFYLTPFKASNVDAVIRESKRVKF